MPKADPTLDLLLAALDGVTSRPMFGGFGLWRDGTFFAIVYRGRAYFKTTPATRPRFCAAGMGPFRPNARVTLRDYYEVPGDVLADAPTLRAWADAAHVGTSHENHER
jgi:DNA transformation protein